MDIIFRDYINLREIFDNVPNLTLYCKMPWGNGYLLHFSEDGLAHVWDLDGGYRGIDDVSIKSGWMVKITKKDI